MPSFVVGIATSAFCKHPERAALFDRLIAQLIDRGIDGERIYIEKEPGTPAEWSERLWLHTYELALKRRATHCVFLNDDVILAPHFLVSLMRLVRFSPDGIWSLRDFHPHARRAYAEGARVLSTDDAVNGNAYMLPVSIMPEMFQFFEMDLLPEARAWPRGEDTKLGLWAMCYRRPCLQCMPALTDHDLSVESAYGNEGHRFRRPMILPTIDAWEAGPVAEVGPTYDHCFWWLRTWLNPASARVLKVIELVYEIAKKADTVKTAGSDEDTPLLP